jgi:hypothetical protein
MARKYEMVREFFNECARNQMRDIAISEVETDDVDALTAQFLVGTRVRSEKQVLGDQTVVFEITVDGLRQRVTFSEIKRTCAYPCGTWVRAREEERETR